MTNNQLIKTIKDWVNKIHPQAKHLIRTGYWVKQLEVNASDELVVACFTHDIERAFIKGGTPLGKFGTKWLSGQAWDDTEYLRWHGKRSAGFVEQFLHEKRVSPEFINKVKRLIEVHEFGGNYQENLIKDADSLSFLEINAYLLISWIPKKFNKKQVKNKIDYMYRRITLLKAKKLAKLLYNKAVQKLNRLETPNG